VSNDVTPYRAWKELERDSELMAKDYYELAMQCVMNGGPHPDRTNPLIAFRLNEGDRRGVWFTRASFDEYKKEVKHERCS
jgi:hypothetical protein